jgi:hypothetical protein
MVENSGTGFEGRSPVSQVPSNRDEIEKEIAELELEIDGNTVKMEQK